jgi:predicted amidohydrolase YtcJ
MLFATLMRGGVALALGSDGGEAEQNPFFNMMLACTYPGWPGEALTRAEGLRAYTLCGAHAERAEGDSGALRTGQLASFAVLSQDVLTVPAADLPATHSVLTLADGVVIHEEKKWDRCETRALTGTNKVRRASWS